jgi:hypothetical protein
MKPKKVVQTNDQKRAAIDNLIKTYRGAFKVLAKDAFQIPTNIYVMKYPGKPGDLGAPHIVFIRGALYSDTAMNDLLKEAKTQPVVFVIRILHYSLMKSEERALVDKSRKCPAKNLFDKLQAEAPTKLATKPSLYYPIGVGFKPALHKGNTPVQIKAAARFCQHVTPLLDGHSMSIIFTKGGTLNHLHKYKLMVQNDEGIIGSIDPGTGHTDVLTN